MAQLAVSKSRTRRSLLILAWFALAAAIAVAARYAIIPLIWHHAAMHYHGHPQGMHYFGHLLRVVAMRYRG